MTLVVSWNDWICRKATVVEQENTREKINVVKLNTEIAQIVAWEQVLQEEIDWIIGKIGG